MNTGDARIMCGMDVRRIAWTPEDTARGEGFVARHGGLLCAMPVGDAAIGLTWTPDGGPIVTVTGATYGEALTRLVTQVAS